MGVEDIIKISETVRRFAKPKSLKIAKNIIKIVNGLNKEEYKRIYNLGMEASFEENLLNKSIHQSFDDQDKIMWLGIDANLLKKIELSYMIPYVTKEMINLLGKRFEYKKGDKVTHNFSGYPIRYDYFYNDKEKKVYNLTLELDLTQKVIDFFWLSRNLGEEIRDNVSFYHKIIKIWNDYRRI